ncbi:MAG: hypothetical protein CVU56_02075 [Deltaproteobacteria bacterium HGW-Deltaproteobacteria-14]|jgi:outer membrane protein assembly factor BamB|nr:MAG: hypothetical protein CVU56_02075 [Deltaproteobacteria bacterium HGW-Deltaproteobacteria-14]
MVAAAVLAFACALVALPRASYAEEPGFYRVSAELGAPFAARWLDPGARELVVSDGATGVGAVRLDSGVVAWSRVPKGGVRGVWATADVVVVAGDTVAVYRRSVGTQLWERALGCGEGGRCQARVLWADERGVVLATGGEVQSAMQRLDLETGEPKWKNPVVAAHPRRVLVAGGTLAVVEGLPPFSVVFVEALSGRERGRWTRRVAGVPRPMSDLWLDPRGELTAAELRPRDGGLLEVALVDTAGHEALDARVRRPAGVDTSPIFATAVGHRLVAFAPSPASGDGRLVIVDLAQASAAPAVVTVPTWMAPVEVGGRLVFARKVGAALTVLGVDPATGVAAWERKLGGLTDEHVIELRAAGELAVITTRSDPTVIWAIAGASGEVVGYRTLRVDGAKVGALVAEPGGLLLAIGQVVERLSLEPVARAAAAFDQYLADDAADDARRLAAELAPLAAVSPTVRRMLERAEGARLDGPAKQFAAGDVAGGLAALGEAIESTADTDGLVVLLGPLSRLVADHLLAARRTPRRAEVDALVGLAARVQRALEANGPAFVSSSGLAARQPEVQRAVVVLALALDKAREPLAGADLMEPVLAAGWGRPSGLDALYRALAYRALDALLKDIRRPLASRRAEQRAEAGRALELFRHGGAALDDPGYLQRVARAVSDDDPDYAREAAREVDKHLRARLATLRRDFGRGYTTSGCAQGCASLRASCEDGCRGAALCDAANSRCVASCSRGGVVRWAPAKPPRDCGM